MGTVVLVLLVALTAVGCSNAPDPSDVPEMKLEPAPGSYLYSPHGESSGVTLDDVTTRVVECIERLGDIQAGEECLEVSGRITNHKPEGWMVTMWANGYDKTGEKVAHTQESALFPGQLGLDAVCGETVAFVMHLNAPEEVRAIRLYAQSFSYADFQPGPPSTPLPQSEITRVVFSREWLIANDAESDPGTVEITFPASWLDEPPDVFEDEDTVELSVPTRLLMDHNTSDNPGEIAVKLPDHYFHGL